MLELSFDLDLTLGLEGGSLSDKRVAKDERPIVRTTPTPGNVLAMNSAAAMVGIGHGSRAVVTQLPASIGNGAIPCKYPFVNEKGLALCLHQGIHDFKTTKQIVKKDAEGNEITDSEGKPVTETKEVVEFFGNKAAIAGLGKQFSSQATWLAMGGKEEGSQVYYLHEGNVAIAVFAGETAGKYEARPVTELADNALAYLVIDCDSPSTFRQVKPADMAQLIADGKVTKFFMLEYLGFEVKPERTEGGAPKVKVAKVKTPKSDAAEEALSLDDLSALEDNGNDDDFGL